MKRFLLLITVVVLGTTAGCRLGCTPYDNCGPVYANPYNCTPNYRSGSAFNGMSANQGTVEYATPNGTVAPANAPATAPATVPASGSAPAAPKMGPVHPAPTAVPAAPPTQTYYRTAPSLQSALRARNYR